MSWRLASRRRNHCLAEVRHALSCSWADVGGSWQPPTIACRYPFPPAVTITSHMPEGPGVLSLANPDEKNPTRKWSLVNPCWYRKREGARDWICWRMWPLARSSWKRWHFTPAQDSIPEHSPGLPLTERKASLPKKEIIWDIFCFLNWLTMVSEKTQGKEGARKRARAAFSGSCSQLITTVTLHSRHLTGSSDWLRPIWFSSRCWHRERIYTMLLDMQQQPGVTHTSNTRERTGSPTFRSPTALNKWQV